MKWELQLIRLYCTVCDNHNMIEEKTQRQSNNFRPQFTDEECITVYLWGIMERKFELKAIYDHTKKYLSDWFPSLPSYQAFCKRLNRLVPAFQSLAELWMDSVSATTDSEMNYVVDSCPIILAKQRRSTHAKVASDLCDKGYNATRNEYYYGVKLHVFAALHFGSLPTACTMMVSPASTHDLYAAKQIMDACHPFCNGTMFADKAYIDNEWANTLERDFSIKLVTPQKHRKDEGLRGNDIFSSFVSAMRQSIESFFNWLNVHTNIQSASKVRSFAGLLLHIFGRIAAVFAACLFYS